MGLGRYAEALLGRGGTLLRWVLPTHMSATVSPPRSASHRSVFQNPLREVATVLQRRPAAAKGRAMTTVTAAEQPAAGWARASLCLYARSLYPHSEHHLPAHFSARASPPVLSPPLPPPRALAPLTARLRRSVVLCRRWRSCGRRTCCCSSCYPGTRDASSRAPLLSSSLPPLPLAATLLLISFLDSFWRGGSGVDQMFAQSCTRFSF